MTESAVPRRSATSLNRYDYVADGCALRAVRLTIHGCGAEGHAFAADLAADACGYRQDADDYRARLAHNPHAIANLWEKTSP